MTWFIKGTFCTPNMVHMQLPTQNYNIVLHLSTIYLYIYLRNRHFWVRLVNFIKVYVAACLFIRPKESNM